MPGFADFYRAINGRDPFPWQRRLAQQVAERQRWPTEIGIPTGLGKTACLDIAVWWLASQADVPSTERRAPTRIWWVVNRRLLVDSTYQHARSIDRMLRMPDAAGCTDNDRRIIKAVALRLRSLAADSGARPLEIIRLRGGIASSIPSDPSQPAIVLCTLPMYGSRLLFRGYGSTLRMRAVNAAMAGTDSLVLLDEAHLAPHLVSLIDALGDCYPAIVPILNPARSRASLVALTATGHAPHKDQFRLDDEDKANVIIQARLNAAKLLDLRDSATTPDGAKALADATIGLIQTLASPTALLIFANSPKTARKALDRIKKKISARDADMLLLTGLTREHEAQVVRTRILDSDQGMAANRESVTNRKRHLLVVATQTLEVGADIDAEYLITETCGVRALIQRLGRLNRFGRYDRAHAIYIHLPPPKSTRGRAKQTGDRWPVYGKEPAVVLEKLRRALQKYGDVNLAPGQVGQILGNPSDPPNRAPEILPGILWEWIKTSKSPKDEAPVEPYFSGIAGEQYKVSIVWRAHVPGDGQRLWPRATDREAVDVPIGEVRATLKGEESEIHRLKPDRVTIECASVEDLRPGDQIILPTSRGLLDEFGWNPAATGTVRDVSLARHGLPLDTEAIKRLCGLSLQPQIEKALMDDSEREEVDPSEKVEALNEVIEAIQSAATPTGWDSQEWNRFTSSLQPEIIHPRKQVPRLLLESPDAELPAEEFDETSVKLGVADIDLHRHCQSVGNLVRTSSNRVGIEPNLVEVLEHAGKLHDIGKADSRFQRWLDPEREYDEPVAKSKAAKSRAPYHQSEKMRAAAGWPRGGRHEALSARIVHAWLDQSPIWCDQPELRDLLVHLVISHHGKGRPLVKPVSDGTAASVVTRIEETDISVPANLEITDWNQPARFRRLNDRFGPWGLALLEALVICADHVVSSGRTSTAQTK